MSANPFSKDYQPKLNWHAQNLDRQRATSVSIKVEEVRLEKNREYGKMAGISKTERVSLLPKNFHVYSKAVPRGKK